ncbi:MAG: serine/threonine protein kinase [Amphiamblys sp. WSBS2006]|nr:MAG: serine/threonine protein kinase [Amphiamblys sp. WSBS2006]
MDIFGEKKITMCIVLLLCAVCCGESVPGIRYKNRNIGYCKRCFKVFFERETKGDKNMLGLQDGAVSIKEQTPVYGKKEQHPDETPGYSLICLKRKVSSEPARSSFGERRLRLGECRSIGIEFDMNYKEQIGKGGQAKTYKIYTKQGEPHVMKVFEKESGFKTEMNALAKIYHKNIVEPLCVIGKENAIVMEYLSGGTLYEKRETATEQDGREYAKQLISAVYSMHADGFVHGDIKPGNILLADKKRTKIKLIDFGFAKPFGEERRFCGTRSTMAPEVLLEENDDVALSSALDWWSVGATLWLIAAGNKKEVAEENRRPYTIETDDGDNPVKITMSEYPPCFSPELKDFLSMLLVRDPAKRQFDFNIDALRHHKYLAGV